MTQEKNFDFLNMNEPETKPRKTGVTEIRSPYYDVMGKRYLNDIMETMGEHVDALKFSGGSFSIMPKKAVTELIDIAHDHDALVSTGGFMELL